MVNNIVLGYRNWVALNESAKPDAIYFTVDFKDNIDIDQLVVKAIELTAQYLSDVCTLDAVSPEKFTISLNEEESFDIFSDIGVTEPLTVETKRGNYRILTYPVLIDIFTSQFRKITDHTKTSSTFTLNEADFGLSDEEIVDKVVNSNQFIQKVNGSFASSIDLRAAEEFLSNKQNIEKAFLAPNPADRTKYSTQLFQYLQKKVFYETNSLIVESAIPFTREEIVMDQFKSQLESKVAEFKKRVETSSASNEVKDLILDIVNFQKKVMQYNFPNDVRRRLASTAIVRTYDLFGEMGLSADDALALLKKQ